MTDVDESGRHRARLFLLDPYHDEPAQQYDTAWHVVFLVVVATLVMACLSIIGAVQVGRWLF